VPLARGAGQSPYAGEIRQLHHERLRVAQLPSPSGTPGLALPRAWRSWPECSRGCLRACGCVRRSSLGPCSCCRSVTGLKRAERNLRGKRSRDARQREEHDERLDAEGQTSSRRPHAGRDSSRSLRLIDSDLVRFLDRSRLVSRGVGQSLNGNGELPGVFRKAQSSFRTLPTTCGLPSALAGATGDRPSRHAAVAGL
jgi:hypothetical protein